MRVLIAWGSKMGGTEGIARIIGEELTKAGMEVVLSPAADVRGTNGYGAAIIGGGLYANRWEKSAYRLLARHIAGFRNIPVWLFSSGPLDTSAEGTEIPPPRQVLTLMERVGALGHATFGGRIDKDAKGFPASAIAKKNAGDWRDPEHIRRWADGIAAALPTARAREPIEPPGSSPARLAGFAVVSWVVSAIVQQGLVHFTPYWVAASLHAILAIVIAATFARSYFQPRGAWPPLTAAVVFALAWLALDAIVLGALAGGGVAMFGDIAMTWLPYVLVFAATWATGAITEMIPERTAK